MPLGNILLQLPKIIPQMSCTLSRLISDNGGKIYDIELLTGFSYMRACKLEKICLKTYSSKLNVLNRKYVNVKRAASTPICWYYSYLEFT